MSGQIVSNIAHIQEEIARQCQVSSRPPNAVMLLAVSKTVNAQGVLHAASAGQRGFGENYVQEGVEKILDLRELAPDMAACADWTRDHRHYGGALFLRPANLSGLAR